MKTNDLIALLQQLDPKGTAEVVLMHKERGYDRVLDAKPFNIVTNPKPRGQGDFLAEDDYRSSYPHGKRDTTPALLMWWIP
jgi:hypothetical protein